MRIMKKIIVKRCKICDKLLRRQNKSLFCTFHYIKSLVKGGKNGNKYKDNQNCSSIGKR